MKTARTIQPPTGGPIGAPAEGEGHARTRERVARSMLVEGPSTAAQLAGRLGLTPAAVRRHLDALVADGSVQAHDPRPLGTRGRPARRYALTGAGRDAFEQAYDDLAVGALRFLAEQGGLSLVEEFARRRVDELTQRYRPAVEAAPADRRAGALAEALTADGYAASARATRLAGLVVTGDELCQHHCPVAHVAEQFPQLCEAETVAFQRLLGTHVQRLATIAHGDGVCTTYVPRRRGPTHPDDLRGAPGAAPERSPTRPTADPDPPGEDLS